MRKILLAAALALTYATSVMGMCMRMEGRMICDVEIPYRNSTTGNRNSTGHRNNTNID
jgi:hypothetical protein